MKVKLTRIDFLCKFFKLSINGNYNTEYIALSNNDYVYCAYDIIKPFKLNKNDIVHATYDEDDSSIGLEILNAEVVKRIKDEYRNCIRTIANVPHVVEFKFRDNYVIISFVKMDETNFTSE